MRNLPKIFLRSFENVCPVHKSYQTRYIYSASKSEENVHDCLIHEIVMLMQNKWSRTSRLTLPQSKHFCTSPNAGTNFHLWRDKHLNKHSRKWWKISRDKV